VEKYPEFTLNFLPELYRPQLKMFGSKSGRDLDKVRESGLSLEFAGETAPYFREAELILRCRKLCWEDLNPAHFTDPALESFFPERDYHRMFIAEIAEVLQKQP
jgi:flavin reductase (DIM6/NTAB) family NADH-FMN oxidoreductase RutF